MLLDKDKVAISVLKGINLMAADLNGKSDPYCIVSSNIDPKQLYKTNIVFKTLNPEWLNTFIFEITKEQLDNNKMIVKFVVMDWDAFSKDDFLGETFLEIDTSAFSINTLHIVQLPLQKTKQGVIEVSVRIDRSMEVESERIRKEKEPQLNELVEKGEYFKVILTKYTMFLFPVTFILQNSTSVKGPNDERLSFFYFSDCNEDFQQTFNTDKEIYLGSDKRFSKEGTFQLLIEDEDVTEVLEVCNKFKIVKMIQTTYTSKIDGIQYVARYFTARPVWPDKKVVKIMFVCKVLDGMENNDWIRKNEIFYNEHYKKIISDILKYSLLNYLD
ncbi:hypothetical protein ABK040_013588 [Willaertia magna]